MKKKKVKFYNQYPFPIRVMNDLNKEQMFAPQGHGRVLNDQYNQSKLTLPIWDKSQQRLYKSGLDVDLEGLLKADLVDLAWAVVLGNKEELEALTKRKLIEAIREKVGDEELDESFEHKRPEIPANEATIEEKGDVVVPADETADEIELPKTNPPDETADEIDPPDETADEIGLPKTNPPDEAA